MVECCSDMVPQMVLYTSLHRAHCIGHLQGLCTALRPVRYKALLLDLCTCPPQGRYTTRLLDRCTYLRQVPYTCRRQARYMPHRQGLYTFHLLGRYTFRPPDLNIDLVPTCYQTFESPHT